MTSSLFVESGLSESAKVLWHFDYGHLFSEDVFLCSNYVKLNENKLFAEKFAVRIKQKYIIFYSNALQKRASVAQWLETALVNYTRGPHFKYLKGL